MSILFYHKQNQIASNNIKLYEKQQLQKALFVYLCQKKKAAVTKQQLHAII
jgi:hypothetical protein